MNNMNMSFLNTYIIKDENIRSGEFCLIGTRLTVEDVLSIVRNGELEDYPYLTGDMVDAAFLYVKLMDDMKD